MGTSRVVAASVALHPTTARCAKSCCRRVRLAPDRRVGRTAYAARANRASTSAGEQAPFAGAGVWPNADARTARFGAAQPSVVDVEVAALVGHRHRFGPVLGAELPE